MKYFILLKKKEEEEEEEPRKQSPEGEAGFKLLHILNYSSVASDPLCGLTTTSGTTVSQGLLSLTLGFGPTANINCFPGGLEAVMSGWLL
jgi:hypothetical protein